MVREGGTHIQTLIQTTLIWNITFLTYLFIPCLRLKIEPNERIELVNNNFFLFFQLQLHYIQDEKLQEDIKEAQCGQEDAQKLLTHQTEIVRDVPFVS